MSQIEDILFAPIHPDRPAKKKPPMPDFLARSNPENNSYDWKPVTERAHEWAYRQMHTRYNHAKLFESGWIIDVRLALLPNRGDSVVRVRLKPWASIDDDFYFEIVS